MLLIAGVSIVLFVATSTLLLTPAYGLYLDLRTVVLGMIQFFCTTTLAAEITLFKNLTAKDRAASGTVRTTAVPMLHSASTIGTSPSAV
jgi:hypothetical protein